MLPKIQVTMPGMKEKMAIAFLKLEKRFDILEGQIANLFALVGLRFNQYLVPWSMLGLTFHIGTRCMGTNISTGFLKSKYKDLIFLMRVAIKETGFDDSQLSFPLEFVTK